MTQNPHSEQHPCDTAVARHSHIQMEIHQSFCTYSTDYVQEEEESKKKPSSAKNVNCKKKKKKMTTENQFGIIWHKNRDQNGTNHQSAVYYPFALSLSF